jgi:hypothetical protein
MLKGANVFEEKGVYYAKEEFYKVRAEVEKTNAYTDTLGDNP